MAWIRLSDDYNDHPKFDHLSDGAFRLWHQGMGFCRRYLTDGLIPTKSIKSLKAYSPKRLKELTTPWTPDAHALWTPIESFGVKVHDYLEWNASKDEEKQERVTSTERMRRFRAGRDAVTPTVTNAVTSTVTNAFVPDRRGIGEGLGISEKGKGSALVGDEIATRARQLVERFGELYSRHRHGARHRMRPNLDWLDACDVCRVWPDDARLEKLIVIFLTTDEKWISGTDRSFSIFAKKATWADSRLAEWEARQRKAGIA